MSYPECDGIGCEKDVNNQNNTIEVSTRGWDDGSFKIYMFCSFNCLENFIRGEQFADLMLYEDYDQGDISIEFKR